MPTYDLGFLGGGQLARMSIQAAQRMGLRCLSLDSGEGGPAAQVADAVVGRLDDPEAIADVLAQCEYVTLENEFIPCGAIDSAFRDYNIKRPSGSIVPGVRTLDTIQDKLKQRQAYARAGVPSPKALEAQYAEEIGFPCVLKARFGGYDGKGTRVARTREEYEALAPLWKQDLIEIGKPLGPPSEKAWLAEEYVPFRRELAVMACVYGNHRYAFPTVETVQTNYVCDLVFPADVDASEIALRAVEAVGGRGLFGVELFETADGRISVNEIAPRPHNTGHYTLDWGGPSQFEAHVRAGDGFTTDRTGFGRLCGDGEPAGPDRRGRLPAWIGRRAGGRRGTVPLVWQNGVEART